MQSPTNLYTPRIQVIDLTGKTLEELCKAWEAIKPEINSLDESHIELSKYNDPLMERQYRHLRQPLEAATKALLNALYPLYFLDCAADRAEAERINNIGLVAA